MPPRCSSTTSNVRAADLLHICYTRAREGANYKGLLTSSVLTSGVLHRRQDHVVHRAKIGGMSQLMEDMYALLNEMPDMDGYSMKKKGKKKKPLVKGDKVKLGLYSIH